MTIRSECLSGDEVKKLSRFKWVKNLDLWSVEITDISFLTSMNKLESLKLGGIKCNINDWSAINNCKNLKTIFAWDVGLSNFNSFIGLSELKEANLIENPISDISGLESLVKLEQLSLWGTIDLCDISSLKKLKNLKTLKLMADGVVDVSVLAELPNLESLDLYGCTNLSNIASLRSCRKLMYLDIRGTAVTDGSVLTLLPNLKYVALNEGMLHIEEIEMLRHKGVDVIVDV